MVKAVYRSRVTERAARPPVTASRTFQTAEDIIPIAELKAQMSDIVRSLHDRPRPLVVTLNGKPAAVVMSPREYDLLSYQSRFVEAVHEGLADVEAGRTHDGEEVIADLLDELRHKKPRKARSR
ncbi:MAG TPA: type II toxin-antitoxin system Phd/YefM family antitoxin [Kofleriaceae bacterium]|jgi:prevent-host-death family protein|nr:type II toxin-antitoxin system Phd/YefM family antitoxin [Kofleriaceae bacterium]